MSTNEPLRVTDVEALLRLLVRHMVDDEDAVMVTSSTVKSLTVFEVVVAQSDWGKLIGTQGQHAKSIRLLLRSIGRKYKANLYLDLLDGQGNRVFPEVEDPGRGSVNSAQFQPNNGRK